ERRRLMVQATFISPRQGDSRMSWNAWAWSLVLASLGLVPPVTAAQPQGPTTHPASAWADYRTVDTAIRAKTVPSIHPAGQPGYPGVELEPHGRDKIVIDQVDFESHV